MNTIKFDKTNYFKTIRYFYMKKYHLEHMKLQRSYFIDQTKLGKRKK